MPRWIISPFSRNAGTSQSSSAMARATPADTASWPRFGGQVPIRPWRCSLSALSSKARIRTICR